MMAKEAAGNTLQANLDVDYVISYRFTTEGIFELLTRIKALVGSQTADKSEAIAGFQKLIRTLASVGLETEVRNGDNNSVLVFVKAANAKKFGDMIYRSR